MLLPPWSNEHTCWGLGMTLVGYGIGLRFLESPMPTGDDCQGKEGVLSYIAGSRWFSTAQHIPIL